MIEDKKPYPWNVLIFPAASEIGMELFRALRDCKEVVLHAANLPGHSLADFSYRHVHALPSVTDPLFTEALDNLIAYAQIDAIFPAHDDVVAFLGARTDRGGAVIVTSSAATCRVARSKKLTYEALRDVVPVPQLFAKSCDVGGTCFVKPECGQGSQRARRIDDIHQLQAAIADEPDLIIMENLPGAEYTVDCFSSPTQGVLFAQARARIQTKTGISVQTRPVDLPQAWDYARVIHNKIPFSGAWFFQIKADTQGVLKILEMAPRIAGSMAASHALGVNLPLLSLYQAMGHQVQVQAQTASALRLGRSLDIRFIDDRPIEALYIDYDDTLLLRDKINIRLTALIFNCRNRGIPVHLISRHKGDLYQSLRRYRIESLFDRIIHITDASLSKADYIHESNAVLIDDSFSERERVRQKCGIRVCDPAGALCLLDDRL